MKSFLPACIFYRSSSLHGVDEDLTGKPETREECLGPDTFGRDGMDRDDVIEGLAKENGNRQIRSNPPLDDLLRLDQEMSHCR